MKHRTAGLSAIMVLGALGIFADTAVDSLQIVADTNIVVGTGETLRIECLWATNAYTVVKSGEGTLVVASVGGSLVSFDVVQGTLKSARPRNLAQYGELRPALRIDAGDTSKFTVEPKNGTNFVTKVADADGSEERYAEYWQGYARPFISDKTQNSLTVLDFGSFKDDKGHEGTGGMLGIKPSAISAREFFYVWEDRPEAKDLPLVDGKTFHGPQILGNSWEWTRGPGGGGESFSLRTSTAPGRLSKYMRMDGAPAKYSTKPADGFHVYNNHVDEDLDGASISTIGYSSPRSGGIRLGEVVVYTSVLDEEKRYRVEAQLTSKWLGAKVRELALRDGAVLDLSENVLRVDTFVLDGEAAAKGMSNLVCMTVLASPTSMLQVADGVYSVHDRGTGTAPSLSFAGHAVVGASGCSNRIESVVSGAGAFVKAGDGRLEVAYFPPEMTSISVGAGTLVVDALASRTSEYHLDASSASSLTTESGADGKELVKEWRDMNDPSRKLIPSTSKKPAFDSSRILRAPYLAEDAAGDLAMVDFGSLANACYPDGYGAALVASKTYSENDGLHDVFAVWRDDPAAKDLAVPDGAAGFHGPSLFGSQYYWYRGRGGGGQSFAMHYDSVSSRMYDGIFRIDGVARSAIRDRVGDGVHVLSQQISGKGAPFEMLGGNDQSPVAVGGETVRGVFGGLAVGEILLFKEALSVDRRLSIEGALRSKWQGVENPVSYSGLEIAAGAELGHPYADLDVGMLELGGKVSAASVKPRVLSLVAGGAVVDGALVLDDGAELIVGIDDGGNFNTVSAASVRISGRGTVSFFEDPPLSFAGREFRIIGSPQVTATVSRWNVPIVLGNGLRVSLRPRNDGLYLVFGGGMSIIVR